MQLSLHKLLPIPLRDRANISASGIWTQSLSFHQGDHIFIQAPSGTGKTTLIHILYNLRNDYQGTVQWDDKIFGKVNKEAVAQLRATHLSVIYQDMRLFPELTAWENLEIKRSLTNTTAPAQVEDWLCRLGLKDKRNSLASTLSYGEQQRVAIIRSLLQPFKWLLMDEPFSHLDKANTAKAISLIGEVVQQNKAGMILADLDENDYFPYTKTILL